MNLSLAVIPFPCLAPLATAAVSLSPTVSAEAQSPGHSQRASVSPGNGQTTGLPVESTSSRIKIAGVLFSIHHKLQGDTDLDMLGGNVRLIGTIAKSLLVARRGFENQYIAFARFS